MPGSGVQVWESLLCAPSVGLFKLLLIGRFVGGVGLNLVLKGVSLKNVT